MFVESHQASREEIREGKEEHESHSHEISLIDWEIQDSREKF